MDGWTVGLDGLDRLDGLDCWSAGPLAGLNGQTRRTGLWDFVRTMGDYCFLQLQSSNCMTQGFLLTNSNGIWDKRLGFLVTSAKS